jgi:hypothetical protein
VKNWFALFLVLVSGVILSRWIAEVESIEEKLLAFVVK